MLHQLLLNALWHQTNLCLTIGLVVHGEREIPDIVLYVVLIFVQSTSKGGQFIVSEDTGEYIG